MGLDGPNWNALAGFGAYGTIASGIRGDQTKEHVQATGQMGAEAGSGAQRIALAVPDDPEVVTTLERPSDETADVPVPADEDHPVPPGIIAPTSQGVVA